MGNTRGVSSPVFTRNHPPGTSRSGERGGRSSLCAQMSQGSKSPFSSERWNVDDLDPMAARFAAEHKRHAGTGALTDAEYPFKSFVQRLPVGSPMRRRGGR
jgi:hypothetical protein